MQECFKYSVNLAKRDYADNAVTHGGAGVEIKTGGKEGRKLAKGVTPYQATSNNPGPSSLMSQLEPVSLA